MGNPLGGALVKVAGVGERFIHGLVVTACCRKAEVVKRNNLGDERDDQNHD